MGTKQNNKQLYFTKESSSKSAKMALLLRCPKCNMLETVVEENNYPCKYYCTYCHIGFPYKATIFRSSGDFKVKWLTDDHYAYLIRKKEGGW